MGVSASPAQAAAKLQALTAGLAALPAAGTTEALKVAQTSIRAAMASAGVAGRLSGVGRRGGRVGVRTRMVSAPAAATGFVSATGAFQFIEGPIRPHRIPRARSRGKRKVIVIPGVGPKASAQHPGAPAKRVWTKGVAAARPLLPRAYEVGLHSTLARIF